MTIVSGLTVRRSGEVSTQTLLMRPFDDAAPLRRIVGFSQDAESHWVARLSCGHSQHVRHEPPLQSRPWVLSLEGRQAHVGTSLSCMECLAGN
jgi:hypothetical protein